MSTLHLYNTLTRIISPFKSKDFINYWKKFIKFREFILSNVDSYYRYNLQVFLDTFIFKYEDVSNHISIIKALQIEAIEIFKKLITQ